MPRPAVSSGCSRPGLSRIPVLHSSDDNAAIWAEIAASAEWRGRPRPQNDTWVAVCCLAYELSMATPNVPVGWSAR
jgi:predicted nucleic acid-binding protein